MGNLQEERTNTFIKKVKNLPRFANCSFEKTIYRSVKEKVVITCHCKDRYGNEHGDFDISPNNALRGGGCQECGAKNCGNGRRRTLDEFIEQAINIHGDKYGYSLIKDYINSATNYPIVCPKHGTFYKTATQHVHFKEGCPYCSTEARRKPKVKKGPSNVKIALTKEEFIDKARKVYGNKYDYSKVEYINNTTPVTIICPEHGEFQQTPACHFHRIGCKQCAHENRRYAEKFIERARKKYGGKFDYSKALEDYVNFKTKVRITCPDHGEFWQTPCSHMDAKHGCPTCSRADKKEKIKGLEDFIKRAKEVHGNKYDYSKTTFVRNNVKTIITCPIHGDFEQTPNAHMCGTGCPKCAYGKVSNKMTKSFESFVALARKQHGDKYDYSKAEKEYVNRKTPVTIICPIHGEFRQKPSNHIERGCPMCGGTQKKDRDYFISEAKKVHGDKYNYDSVVYVNMRQYVDVICPEHGKFRQKPYKHLNGQGCPLCNESHYERDVAMMLGKNGVEYKREVRFDWLGTKELDFYLPKYGIAIECQGEQHFIPINFGWNEKRNDTMKEFRKIKKRDKEKLTACIENNVPLLYYGDEKFLKYEPSMLTSLDTLLEKIRTFKEISEK